MGQVKLSLFGVRPAGRFYLVAALMLVTLFTALATGFGLFHRLLYIMAATTVLAYGWNWLTVRSVVARGERRTRQTQVGDTVEESISVHNQSRLPKYALEVEDLTDLPGHSGGMAIGLAGNASESWTSRMAARTRGVYTLGPVRVANTDPFGLFRKDQLFGETDTVVVFPRILDLSEFEVPPADMSGDSSVRKRSHTLSPHASSVRDYALGDSLSRVHWNSSARLGKLMSKEFDLGRAAEVWVLIDLQRDAQAGELEESTDEYAVSIGASLAKRYLDAGLPVGLVAYGDERYFLPAETGPGQLQRLLQYLALSKAEGTTPLEVALPNEEPLWSHQSTLVVVTASPSVEWVLALRELARRGVKVVVVLLDNRSFGGVLDTSPVLERLYVEGVPTYPVRRGDNIRLALRRSYTPETERAERTTEVAANT